MLVWLCLGQGADLYTAQLMPLPLTISCSSKSRLVLPFWCRLTRVVPDKIQEGRKMVVCVCVYRWTMKQNSFTHLITHLAELSKQINQCTATKRILNAGPICHCWIFRGQNCNPFCLHQQTQIHHKPCYRNNFNKMLNYCKDTKEQNKSMLHDNCMKNSD